MKYDIKNDTDGKRIRKVAKICEGYGVRVQDSVFEMKVDSVELRKLHGLLTKIIDPEIDSVRIYKIGKKMDVEIIGGANKIEVAKDAALMF